jgi:hypothetical protein
MKKMKNSFTKHLRVGYIIYQNLNAGMGRSETKATKNDLIMILSKKKTQDKTKMILRKSHREIWVHSNVTFYKRERFDCPNETLFYLQGGSLRN